MKAVIIGATSGIGREVAIRLLEEGWTVGITGRRTAELEAIKQKYVAGKVFTATMDITRDDATAALDGLLAALGAPDLYLHVSGVGYQSGPLDEEKELLTAQTNACGLVRLTSHFLNYIKDSGAYSRTHRARIAVISSIAGTAGLGAAPAYSATKRMQSHYVSALAQYARMEKLPVRFTDIRPGFVATALLASDKKYPMLITPQKAAKIITKGLKRGRRVIIVDWRYRVLVFFWRLIPRPVWERLTMISN